MLSEHDRKWLEYYAFKSDVVEFPSATPLLARVLLETLTERQPMKTILEGIVAFLQRNDIPGTSIDNALLEILLWFIAAPDESRALAYLAVKMEIPPGALTVESDEITDDVKAELASAPFSADDLLRYLPYLVAFFNWFRSKRSG